MNKRVMNEPEVTRSRRAARRRTWLRAWALVAPAGCITILALVLITLGCAGLRAKPPAPFYEASPADVRGVDASCLIGKRIVIDPGHGGVFRGASGPGGLKEADVNLGVALYLWGLLRDGGADVLLTRSSDIDFVDGSAAKLREDLSARAEIAAAFKPHLFVSVHHNADVARSKDTNQVETYFKMLDEGPSKDVATLIHQRLTERLQIVRGSVVPGNYFVLRNARCAAVLGEPSYITNPWVEQRLRLAEKQLLEAQAYYLGIVEYFSRGLASIAALSPSDTVLAEARPRLSALLSEDCSGVDMSTVTCELDGEPLKAFLQPSTRELVASPQAPLGNGTHKFCFTFRNDLGNSSGKQCASFDTDLPPAALLLEAQPLVIPKDGGVLVTATVADENGNFVRDGTPVRFLSAAGVFSAETVRAVAGIASSVFFSDRTTDAVSVAVTSGGAEDSLLLAPSDVVTTCLSIVDSRNGEPLSDARILEGDSLVSVTSPQGLAVIAGFTEGRVVMRNGYIPTLIPSQTGAVGSPREMPAVTMRPVALGVLHGARLALDVGSAEPRDRGIEPDTAASGYCASAAGELRGLLVGAGADVLMLPADVPDTEKVAAAELFAAQRYIRIEPAPGRRASVLSYPGSSSGMKLAVTLVHWWSKVVRETEPEPSEDAHYILRQTSAPAVILRIPAGRLPERVPARRLAYALYLASLEDMGLGASQMIESSVKATGVLPGEAADMVLDGFIHVPLSEDGSATFFCEEGQHMIAVVSKSKQTAPRFVSVRPASQAGEGTR